MYLYRGYHFVYKSFLPWDPYKKFCKALVCKDYFGVNLLFVVQ